MLMRRNHSNLNPDNSGLPLQPKIMSLTAFRSLKFVTDSKISGVVSETAAAAKRGQGTTRRILAHPLRHQRALGAALRNSWHQQNVPGALRRYSSCSCTQKLTLKPGSRVFSGGRCHLLTRSSLLRSDIYQRPRMFMVVGLGKCRS